MKRLTRSEVINDWIDFLDQALTRGDNHELWQNRKTLVLDSIEVLNYIREMTSDFDINYDNRIKYLLGLCGLPCRDDYYHRFLKFNDKYYRTENDWWVDCWQTIRMKNILHKFGLVDLNSYLSSESDGEYFSEKWPVFFEHSKFHKEKGSLAAYSYLECIRFLLYIKGELDYTLLSELKEFLKKLYEIENGRLKYHQHSNELRANSLNLINCIRSSSKDNELDDIYTNIKNTLEGMIEETKWDQFSFTWATFFLFGLDEDLLIKTKSKIPNDFFVDLGWISSTYHTRKPRYALLASIDKLENCNYFELIKPNPVLYTPNYKFEQYLQIITVLDRTVQSLKQVRDIQEKIAKENYDENYFRDLLRLALSANKGEEIEYAEKEGFVSSGRTTDILLIRRNTYPLQIEWKALIFNSTSFFL